MHRIKMNDKTTEILFILTILAGAMTAAQKTLPEDGTLGDLAWKTLLQAGQAKSDQERDTPLPNRRITTKSLFIAPQIGLESVPDCPDGHRVNTKGDCVKVITLDQTAHLEFLLQKLNSQYATEEIKDDSYDYDIEDASENTGPFQFNIPLPYQMSGPKPEDSEGSEDTFILTKKEIRNPAEELHELEDKMAVPYPEDLPKSDPKNQFFLDALPNLSNESVLENRTKFEIPVQEINATFKNKTYIIETVSATNVNNDTEEELDLESELELLKLHVINQTEKQENFTKEPLEIGLTSVIKGGLMADLTSENNIPNKTHHDIDEDNTRNSSYINSTAHSIDSQIQEDYNYDIANKMMNNISCLGQEGCTTNLKNIERFHNESETDIKNITNYNNFEVALTNDSQVINASVGSTVNILNAYNNTIANTHTSKTSQTIDNIDSLSNMSSIEKSNSTVESSTTVLNKSKNIENTKEIPKDIDFLDLLTPDPDLKLDNKVKIISRIADVTTDDTNLKKVPYENDAKIEDPVVEATAPIKSNYVHSSEQSQYHAGPHSEQDKPMKQSNYLNFETLNRKPYWWLPPGWEVRPPKDRSHLIDFWSRLPLVTDPSFNYPYIRRPQRHYQPYQHSLYPHPQITRQVGNFDMPIINYRMARQFYRGREDPVLYNQANMRRWDSHISKIAR